VEQRPAPKELKQIYDHLFAEGEYEVHRREFEFLRAGRKLPNFERPRLLRQVRRIVRGQRLVEIGGGTGKFGLDAIHQGWEYTNYDISETAVRFCRRLGLDARTFVPTDPPPLEPGSIDLIVMWEVLEHLWHVRQYLDMIRVALRPGGALLLSTPNYHAPVWRDQDEWGPLSSPRFTSPSSRVRRS
jgi:2-polyprenyl-3-methyl-5-hydroxy-6-metoxy-1,4-benzoquinol methylase